MEWLNGLTYNKKLKTSFMFYMLIFLMLGLSFTEIVGTLIERYTAYIGQLYFIEQVIEDEEETLTYFKLNTEGPTKLHKTSVNILNAYSEFSLIINLFIFSMLGFLLYFKDKIDKPIKNLQCLKVITQIEEDSFLESKDEMLGIVYSYNEMVDTVKMEKKKMWIEIEEIEQMMASFEHDIRTPITIIRGYNDMILKYYPEGKMNDEKLERTLINTKIQIDRLDEYIKRMSNLKNIKELELNIRLVETKLLLNNMNNIGRALLKEKMFKMNNNMQSDNLYLDENIILEVYENILTNGFRHAETIIGTNVDEDENYIVIKVQDDGKGFSQEALKYATIAFFSENKLNGENVGLGLNISKELCQKHNGTINLSNNSIGGLVEIRIKKFNSETVDRK